MEKFLRQRFMSVYDSTILNPEVTYLDPSVLSRYYLSVGSLVSSFGCGIRPIHPSRVLPRRGVFDLGVFFHDRSPRPRCSLGARIHHETRLCRPLYGTGKRRGERLETSRYRRTYLGGTPVGRSLGPPHKSPRCLVSSFTSPTWVLVCQ